MSGHSKWHKVKHQKALKDPRKGKIFSKLSQEITSAAKKDPNPETNPLLREVIEKAKKANLPKDKIERAIARATGKGLEGKLQSFSYGAYGPGGVAMIIEGLTDNTRRTLAELRHLLKKHQGEMAELSAVQFLFEKRGLVVINLPNDQDIEQVQLKVIEAGADDLETEEDMLIGYCLPQNLALFEKTLKAQSFEIKESKLGWLAKTKKAPKDPAIKAKLESLFQDLSEIEEVEEVYTDWGEA